MTITEIKKKTQEARRKLQALSLENLIIAWEVIDKREITAGVISTRGWIMDELESRNKESFDKWIDSDNGDVREFYKIGA